MRRLNEVFCKRPQTLTPSLCPATELTCQLTNDQLQLALKGLSVPEAKQTPSAHVPVLALSLEAKTDNQPVQTLWH